MEVKPCLLAEGPKATSGHVVIWWRKKQNYAHRKAYTEAHGEIPPGLVVRHTCDVPACIEPSHLVVGTHADNSNDRSRRNRHHNKKLSDEQVVEIKAALSSPYIGIQKALAAKYGVDASTISHIKCGHYRTRG